MLVVPPGSTNALGTMALLCQPVTHKWSLVLLELMFPKVFLL